MWNYRGDHRPPFAIAPGDGQESVWDYPRPPALSPDYRAVSVHHGEHCLARADRSIRVLETASPPTFYLPPESVHTDLLRPVTLTTFCEWKGTAHYYALADDPSDTPVAWYYARPYPRFADIAGHVAFYPRSLQCYVGGVPVRAQSGGFYGGWITPEIVGPFKGETGTGGW